SSALAQVVRVRIGGEHERAQLAAVALGRGAGDGAHEIPHFIEHVLAAARADAAAGIGMHVQPMGVVVPRGLGAEGGVAAVDGQLFNGAHGDFLGGWPAGRTVGGGPDGSTRRDPTPPASQAMQKAPAVAGRGPVKMPPLGNRYGAGVSRSSRRRILPTLVFGSSLR